MARWGFYGRRTELAEVERLLDRGEFFFCAISGRRRIGKTSLMQEALLRNGGDQKAIYVQIPDSDERGVVQAFEDALEDARFSLNFSRNYSFNFSQIAITLMVLWEKNFITAIDEFQYFHRKSLQSFLSYLQSSIDDARSNKINGGLFVFGSINTEMTTVIDDQLSPIFNRTTDRINISHWDFETLFEMFRDHGIRDPYHRLFLWSIFEGVPKFYRDCFDQGTLHTHGDYRRKTIARLFFEGSSPLRDEADNWFLRELRGRYDSVLKLVARIGPCSHGQLKDEYARTGPSDEKQLGAYLKILIEKYEMIEKVNPVFAGDGTRKARYQISDNFLSAWLSSIARNVRLARIRPIPEAVAKTDEALKTHEGKVFEKMIRLALEECSRKAVGDFSLTDLVKGYWNKPDGSDIEIDIVAINETDKILRLGSCKRAPEGHDGKGLTIFEGHIDRFLKTQECRRFADYRMEKALYSPLFGPDQKAALVQKGYYPVDMTDIETWLTF